MQRHLLGLIAAAFLLFAVGSWLLAPSEGLADPIAGGSFRIAILLGVMWLALPNVIGLTAKLPAWLVGTTLIALIVMAARPKSIVLLGPVLLAIWVLTPQWFARKK